MKTYSKLSVSVQLTAENVNTSHMIQILINFYRLTATNVQSTWCSLSDSLVRMKER